MELNPSSTISLTRYEVTCQKCSRSGCYQKVTPVKKIGDDVILLDPIGLLASDCEYKPELGNQGYGATYQALTRVPRHNQPLGFYWQNASG